MTHIAVYPGSFDPPTKGHEDLVRRSLALADRLIVAVAVLNYFITTILLKVLG